MILRLFNIYGPGEDYNSYRSVIALFCYRAMMGIPYTVYTNSSRTFLYIDDFVRTVGSLSDNFLDGEVINISGTENINIKDLSDMILSKLNLTDEQVIYEAKEMFNVDNKIPSSDKALSLLNHVPQMSLDEGIERTLEWMKKIYVS
jgi:dTDP-glucose 4,6-dehydratase